MPLPRLAAVRPLEDRLPPGDLLLTALASLPSAPMERPHTATAVSSGRWLAPAADTDAVELPADEPTPAARRTERYTPTEALEAEEVPTISPPPALWWGVRVPPPPEAVAADAPAVASSAARPVAEAAGPAVSSSESFAQSIGLAQVSEAEPTEVVVSSPAAVEPVPVPTVELQAPEPFAEKVTPELPFTDTEVLAGIWGADPLATLKELAADLPIDPAGSRVMFTLPDGQAVMEVRLQPGADPKAVVAALSARPEVAYAEPNHVFVGDAREWTPNDPSYSSQFFHTKSKTDLAWDIQTGSPSIVVGVTDDGVGFNHPDLAPNVWVNPGEIAGNAKDDDGNGFVDDARGWDFNANDNSALPSGSSTHGTHVAGIVAARSGNGVGVAGTAGGGNGKGDGVRLMPLRWDGPAGWTAAMVANSFTYAANNGAKIVTSSYNFDGFATNTTVLNAYNFSYGKGVLHFNSAGNNNQLNPARQVLTQTLMVGSLDSADVKSSFSNYGAFVDISAHGSNIFSTLTSADGTGVSYGSQSGTSMSTPHAAGAAALIWSQNPTWTRDQVAAQLLGTADSIAAANPAFVNLLGTGRINPFRALTETLPAPRLGSTAGFPTAPGVGPTSFSVFTPWRLDPASVAPANFELRRAGPDGALDTADDVLVPLTINAGTAYQIGTDKLTFTWTGGAPLPYDSYRFTAFGGASKLRNPFGTALDGDANGSAGGDFRQPFAVTPQVGGRAFEDRNGNGALDPNEPGLAGRTVFVDLNGNGTVDAASGFSQANSTALPIPDTNTKVFSDLTVSGKTGTVQDVDVTVNITHPYVGDLNVFLVAPSGARVELFTGVGANGDNFAGTILDQQAAVVIGATGTAAPFTGRFRPEGDLSAVNGLNPNGLWRLEIADVAAQDVGTLTGWTLAVQTQLAEPTATTDATGGYLFNGLASSATYTVRTVSPAGWIATNPAGVLAPLPTAAAAAAGVNLGSAKNDRFYARLFDDRNGSGGQDAGEPALAGRRVFADANTNGSFDAGEPNVLTDAAGDAWLDLPAGAHALRAELPTDWTGFVPASGVHAVTAAGGPFTGRLFGGTLVPAMAGMTVNDGTAQRSRVSSLRVTFNQGGLNPTQLAQAFALTRPGGPTVTPLVAVGTASDGRTEATLTFAPGAGVEAGSLADGAWTVSVDKSKVLTAAGLGMATSASPAVFRLFGDVDGDRSVTTVDLDALASAFGTSAGEPGFAPALDADADGSITTVDLDAFASRFGVSV